MADFDIKCGRCHAPLSHRCGGTDLLTAIKQLYKFIPESGTPKAVITEGKKNGMWSKDDDESKESLPVFTETFLYALFGKEDARTLLALLSSVIHACGLESWKIEHQAWHELARKEAVVKYERRYQELLRARNKRNNKRMCTCGHPYEIHHTTETSRRVRVCTKCDAKCKGFDPVAAKDKLEVRLPTADLEELKKLRDEIIELQKDPDEERAEKTKRDWIHMKSEEEDLANRIATILEDNLDNKET